MALLHTFFLMLLLIFKSQRFFIALIYFEYVFNVVRIFKYFGAEFLAGKIGKNSWVKVLIEMHQDIQ